MSNLIDKYGSDWFREKFKGSFFMYEGMPALLEEVHGRKDQTVTVVPRNRSPKSILISKEYFVDSAMFCVPELGYRHFGNGGHLVYLSRNNRSYKRGLGMGNLDITKSELTFQLENARTIPRFQKDVHVMCSAALCPNFVPLHKGIALMLKGKLLSFAASPTVAVVPDTESDKLLLLVAGRQVGHVMPDGSLSYNITYASNYIEG